MGGKNSASPGMDDHHAAGDDVPSILSLDHGRLPGYTTSVNLYGVSAWIYRDVRVEESVKWGCGGIPAHPF